MDEPEWKTRKTRIDKSLREFSPKWDILRHSYEVHTSKLIHHAVEEYPTENGPADYALFVKGKLLAIIEAKKVAVDPQNVLEQAKRYASGVPDTIGRWGNFRVPFIYSSNGTRIWFADLRDENYTARELTDFHTADALEEMFAKSRDSYSDWFKTPNNIEKLRPYQLKAIASTEKGIVAGKRNMMLAMATGTGKTYTTVSLVYRLIKSGFARRILFLVDRRALASQTAQAFASFITPSGNKFNQEYEVFTQRFKKEDFEEGEKFDVGVMPNDYLTTPKSSHTFVYVATIQRMAINLFGREGSFQQTASEPEIEDDDVKALKIPIHAFDVIIADECHRGYTSKDTNVWRSILNHFDSVRIGLTATPASHTVAFFGKPIFKYTVEQAIIDGFLVDYQAVKIKSNVRMEGIFLTEGEKVGLKDVETGTEFLDSLEDERDFESTEIEQKITSPDSNRKIIEEIHKYAKEHEERTGRFPKTLIFAVNDISHASHADSLVSIAREVFGRGDEFVQKITGSPSVDRPLEKIRRFRNRPMPAVVVTVDMLSTGVDIPALEFIVFLRPVKSRILWTQMLGRGTRPCRDIHKEYFTIFDCFDGTLIEYFKNSTDFVIEVTEQAESVTIGQVIENIWNNVDREYNEKRLVKRLRRIAETMSGKARKDFSNFIPDGDITKYADALRANLKSNFIETMKLLRNPDMQNLIVNYERAKNPFIIAYDNQDTVTSEVVFKVGDKRLQPTEYLTAFSEFIHNNKEKIDALSILMKNPAGWNSKVLKSIREELKKNAFDEEQVRKAHKLSGHQALADIISLIKNADDGKNPLLTAEERVNKAVESIISKHELNSEQKEWLGYIREHLIVNLAIEKETFDLVPVLERHGGLSRAGKIFGQAKLESIITDLNLHIAA